MSPIDRTRGSRAPMKKYLKALVNLIIALIIFLTVIIVMPKLLIFFLPFVAGWIIALIASPMVRFFEEKIKLKRKAGSVFVIVAVIGLVVLLFYLVGARLAEEIIRLVNSLPEMWEGIEAEFNEIGNNFNIIYQKLPQNIQITLSNITEQIGSYVGSFIKELGTPTIAAVGNFAKQLPSIIINIIMSLLSAYFFVADRSGINAWFSSHMPEALQTRYQLVKKSLVRAVGGYFKAQLKIEIWMYILLVIGFTILQVDYALLIAIGIAFLDFLPFFGTGTIMVPWAIIKILSADYRMAIGLLVIWGVGQLARQVIQPKIVGDSVGVPPIPTLFLLYIGYKLSGVIGMIVAVPIGLIVYTMYEEGVFDTTKNSILILASGINRFRRLQEEDLQQIKKEDVTGKNAEAGKEDNEKY